jgi:hypothetical protein
MDSSVTNSDEGRKPISIPKRGRGRPTAAADLAYQEQVREFCNQIEEIQARDEILRLLGSAA